MSIKEWLKAKKQKRAAKKQDKITRKPGNTPEIHELDATEPEIPKTRFTEEYKEFLARQEAERLAAEEARKSAEAAAEVERSAGAAAEEFKEECCCHCAEKAAENTAEQVKEAVEAYRGEEE